MPFPLAHPAAVLPMKGSCPRWLNFPCLVIGSLCPDLGYCFPSFRLDLISHQWLLGAVGFCIPVGCLALGLFKSLQTPLLFLLPARLRELFEHDVPRDTSRPLARTASLVIGAWSHILLDSLTHSDGWLVDRSAMLRTEILICGMPVHVYSILYTIFTFGGVMLVARAYLTWLESVTGETPWPFSGFKTVGSLALAATTLGLALPQRHSRFALDLPALGGATAGLIYLFLVTTAQWLPDRESSNTCELAAQRANAVSSTSNHSSN